MKPDSTSKDWRNSIRVAIIHEWFIDYSGSERVVEQMLNIFPQADLYAQVEFLPDNLRGFIKNKKVNTSFIQKLPGAKTKYRNYLPLMPLAVEQFDMSKYDLVISSNHAVAKGVITGPNQLHICMCYSPMRYAWDLTHHYLEEAGLTNGLKSWIARYILHRIRMWDCRTANGVDEFIAISDYIACRIKKTYHRKSTVIYPPVDTNGYSLYTEKEDFYLMASRMVPYKNTRLVVEAFSKMPDKKLVVVGDGPDMAKVKRIAGPNVTLMGYLSFEELKKYMQRAKALIYAAEEDFGIVPVEAQACGTPVIAYGRGGALETVVDGKTGIFFYNRDVSDVVDIIQQFESMKHHFNPEEIRANALKFSADRFRAEFRSFIDKKSEDYFNKKMRKDALPSRSLRLRRESEVGQTQNADNRNIRAIGEEEGERVSNE